MNAMLTKYLKDFSLPQSVGPVGNDILDTLHGSSLTNIDFSIETEPPVDIEAERRDAHDEGFREAAAYYERKQAEAIAALEEAHANALQAMADRHESETIWVVHARFHEMTQAISQTVTEQVLQLLLPVFDEEFCRRSMERLSALVREALSEAQVSTVVVRGPEPLYIRLKPLLEVDGIESRFIESAAVDISVEVDETVLVTRLSSWSQALSEVDG